MGKDRGFKDRQKKTPLNLSIYIEAQLANPHNTQDNLLHRPPRRLSGNRERHGPQVPAVQEDEERFDVVQQDEMRVRRAEGEEGKQGLED